MKHIHKWKKEMVWKDPNFFNKLLGKKKKLMWVGEGYFICKCEARSLQISEFGNKMLVQE